MDYDRMQHDITKSNTMLYDLVKSHEIKNVI